MRSTKVKRRAFTLIELIASAAIMAILTTSGFVIVRTANTAWIRHRDDSNRRREAVVALEHIVRNVRQARHVTAITAAADTAGALTVVKPSGTACGWSRVSGTNQLLFGAPSPTNLLAAGITELTFVGLKANGTTATTETDLIHAVRCTVKYTVTRPAGTVTETASRTAWLRAW